MKRLSLYLSALIFAVCFLAPFNVDALDSAPALALEYCKALEKGEGMPRLLTPALRKMIEAAGKRDASKDKEASAAALDIQSYPDRSPICEPGRSRHAGGHSLIDVRHIFAGDVARNWTDVLVVTSPVAG